MEQLERFLLIASAGDDVTRAINFAELDAVAGAQRSQYLGAALQKVGAGTRVSGGGGWRQWQGRSGRSSWGLPCRRWVGPLALTVAVSGRVV